MHGKRIILGISGGIAAFKAPILVRNLLSRGAEISAVLTPGAAHFVTPATLQAVSGRRVRDDLWDVEAEAAMGHIELARWADAVLVAPATAHLISRLAQGAAGQSVDHPLPRHDRPGVHRAGHESPDVGTPRRATQRGAT